MEKVMDGFLPPFSSAKDRFGDQWNGTCAAYETDLAYEMDLVEFWSVQRSAEYLHELCSGKLSVVEYVQRSKFSVKQQQYYIDHMRRSFGYKIVPLNM